jgi:hypothetical protein
MNRVHGVGPTGGGLDPGKWRLTRRMPECAAMRQFSLRGEVLRFPSHDKRKTRTRIQIDDGQSGKQPGKWLEERESNTL